jgi:hypothetical protein
MVDYLLYHIRVMHNNPPKQVGVISGVLFSMHGSGIPN